MNKYDLIDIFFNDQEDYIKFLVGLEQRIIANDATKCLATLEKKEGCFLYTLNWMKDGKYIGDYITPFRATKENIETFNNGCKTLAERLEIYIDTNDASKVPNDFPAFGILTEYK
jgi:hypothetical protein